MISDLFLYDQPRTFGGARPYDLRVKAIGEVVHRLVGKKSRGQTGTLGTGQNFRVYTYPVCQTRFNLGRVKEESPVVVHQWHGSGHECRHIKTIDLETVEMGNRRPSVDSCV